MAHNPTHRRNLAAPSGPNSPMDPTHKRYHPKIESTPTATTATTKNPYRHPPDPDPTTASFTIKSISKHFSKLYTNQHNRRALESSRASHSNLPSKRHIDTHLQAKAMTVSLIEDSSAKPTAKSVEMEKEKLRIAVSSEKPKRSKETQEIQRASDLIVEGRLNLRDSHEGFDLKRLSFPLGGRRRSFCNSQLELADFFSCNGAKVVSVDMPPFMQVHAVDRARKTYDSLEKFTSKTLAFTLKKEFDKVYGPAWHCIVGTSFGSFVTHSVGGFLYFSMDHKLYILLFKTTVQRADSS